MKYQVLLIALLSVSFCARIRAQSETVSSADAETLWTCLVTGGATNIPFIAKGVSKTEALANAFRDCSKSRDLECRMMSCDKAKKTEFTESTFNTLIERLDRIEKVLDAIQKLRHFKCTIMGGTNDNLIDPDDGEAEL